MLARVCRLARDLLGVSRATVLVLEEGERLVPAVSVARDDHAETWQRFGMRPASLALTPAVAGVLRHERVVLVPDARTSPLVPDEWRAAFSLTSLAVAPLHVHGRPWGALVVDDLDARREFGADDVRLLSEVAALVTATIAATERAAAADGEVALREAVREALARLPETRDLAAAVDAIAPHLLHATGYELLDAVLSDRRLAPAFAVPRTGEYKNVLRQLRNGASDAPSSDGRLVVPLRSGGALLGLFELRSHGRAPRRLDLLHETAERFSDAVALVAANDRAAAATADAQHGAERVALALAAIDRTLRAFRGPGYALRGGATLVSVTSTAATRRAIEELDDVRQVLAAVSAHATVGAALRALLDGGPNAPYELVWTPTGAARPVGPASEIALLRTAVRFLSLARRARGSVLSARLSFTSHGVECQLSTNGLLPDLVESGAEPIGPWVRDAGGSAEFASHDSMFSVRCTVPYDSPDRSTARPRLR